MITETCGCGASITAEHGNSASERRDVEDWRVNHRHAKPESRDPWATPCPCCAGSGYAPKPTDTTEPEDGPR